MKNNIPNKCLLYLIIFTVICYAVSPVKAINPQQKIIIINGSSSAGKTSIIKEMQRINDTPFLATGIDQWWDIIPPQYTDGGIKASEGFYFTYTTDETDNPIIIIKIGSFLKSLYPARSAVIKSLLSSGHDVIFDEVFLEDTIVEHYTHSLSDYTVYLIGVTCALEELERREKARGDREIGLARWQINNVYKYRNYYDYTVDTTHTSTKECAEQIIAYIQNNPTPTGLQRLKLLFVEKSNG